MFRLCLAFVIFPNLASADGALRPAQFSYTAAFNACTLDPTEANLAAHCATVINDAYMLRRAVARATQACADTPLGACTLPFEDEGLPAVAMHIAVSAGCDTTPPPEGAPFGDNHCIALAADIMEEEGVVPLDSTLTCDTPAGACTDLLHAQSVLWQSAITELSGTNLTSMRMNRVLDDCQTGTQGAAETYACHVPQLASIWAELKQNQQEN